jgi:hypothetical protein
MTASYKFQNETGITLFKSNSIFEIHFSSKCHIFNLESHAVNIIFPVFKINLIGFGWEDCFVGFNAKIPLSLATRRCSPLAVEELIFPQQYENALCLVF